MKNLSTLVTKARYLHRSNYEICLLRTVPSKLCRWASTTLLSSNGQTLNCLDGQILNWPDIELQGFPRGCSQGNPVTVSHLHYCPSLNIESLLIQRLFHNISQNFQSESTLVINLQVRPLFLPSNPRC